MIVGYDGGYGYAKGASERGVAVLPAALAPAVEIRYRSDLHSNGAGLTVQVDGKPWFVGELARRQGLNPISPRTRERSAEFERVLLVAALHELDARESVALVAGRPVAWYGDRGTLETALRGYHHAEVNGELAVYNVTDAKIVPQPFGTLFGVILDEEGALLDPDGLRDGQVAILDVGMYTSDYAVSDALHYVEERSGSIPYAMSNVYGLLQKRLSYRYGRELTLEEAEETAKERGFRDWGEWEAVDDYVEAALEQVAERVVGEAQTLWGDGRDLDTVLVTGGGGAAMFEAVRARFPQAQLVEAAQTANARGFYRYAVRCFGASE